jgi:hypothetical protein
MNDGGKGDKQRPTDHKKWSSGYDNIQWTKEEDEEFDRIQDSSSSERTVALPATKGQRAEIS